MKLYTTFILVLLSFVFCACSSSDLSKTYNNSFDFNPLDTYKIVKTLPIGPGGQAMPSATFNLIKSAIDLDMAKKGFGKNKELADFGITWHTALNDEVYENTGDLTGWQKAFSKNDTGMLIIDIIYLKENKLVWRGWAKDVLSSENLEENIKEAVTEILEHFPPKSVPTGN